MKIAIIGYGRMGQEIASIAKSRGHEIALIIDADNQKDLNVENLQKCDVAIEFTTPATAVGNYLVCFEAGVPVVSGTTGWLDQMDQVRAKMDKSEGGALFYASNFSLGVNLFFELNKKLAAMMKGFDQYNVEMTEVHHTAKLDAPSGTAISLAEDIFEYGDIKSSWDLEKGTDKSTLHIDAVREGSVPGIHIVKYESEVDYIEITHSAHSRKGFALGAVLASEFSAGKSGFLGMDDMLKF